MTTLMLGATGATGRLLVRQLLARGEPVRAIVRDRGRVDQDLRDRIELFEAEINALDDAALDEAARGVRAVGCCLGHTLSFKGIYGKPRRLVRDAVARVCAALERGGPPSPVRFALMNTAGNQNRDLKEPLAVPDRILLGFIRVALPPHRDNEAAADHLRTAFGRDAGAVEWVVVRPDSLIDEDEVTPYVAHPSPTRSALFNPGKTSRINVAAFMAKLLLEDDAWARWKGQMPVLYNEVPPQAH